MCGSIDPDVQITLEFNGTDEAAEEVFETLQITAANVGIHPPEACGEPLIAVNEVASWSWTFIGEADVVIRFLQQVFADR